MKTNTISCIAAGILVSLLGCQSDLEVAKGDVHGDERIEFNACTVVPETKAVIEGTTFPTSRTMYVTTAVPSSSVAYFSNVEFIHAGTYWASNPASYWPLTGTLEVFAYSKGDINATANWTGATNLTLTSTDFTADDLLIGGLAGASKTNNEINFHHALTRLNFTATSTVSSAIKVKSLTVKAKKAGTVYASKSSGSSAVTITSTATGSSSDVLVFSGDLTVTSSFLAVGDPVVMLPQTPESVTITYTLNSNGVESSELYSTIDLSQSCLRETSYTFAITFNVSGISITPTVTPWNSGGTLPLAVVPGSSSSSDGMFGYENGHKWVDLGLRLNGNKILVSTTNVGADSPDDYGDYYSWGEANIHYSNISGTTVNGGTFDWENTPYHTGSNNSTGWTKYIPSNKTSFWSGSGSPDNLNVLQPEDDPASYHWSGRWRTPTLAELQLFNNTSYVTYSWVTNWENTGKNGLVITGKGDYSENSIIIPASGHIEGTLVKDSVNYCDLWTSSLDTNNPNQASSYYSGASSRGYSSSYRFWGRPVRPVFSVPVE